MKTEEAFKIIGGSLSKPSKMPGWSIGLPAKECKTGSKLRKVKGSRLTPSKRHWLPTREAWIKDHVSRAPDNLIIRFSMPMIDQAAAGGWANTSTVVSAGANCPSAQQGNQCLDCRKCWNKEIKNISYGQH
jgi:hypothetical protein